MSVHRARPDSPAHGPTVADRLRAPGSTGTIPRGALLPALLGLACATLAVPPLAAQSRQESAAPPTVRVDAAGTVRLSPDRVVLAVGVENFADSAGAAAAENAERVQAVLEALRSRGVPDERLQTTGYRLEPEYEREAPPEREGPRRIARYRAWNLVRVTLESAEEAGRLLDAAVAAGANQVVGVSFGLSEEREEEAGRQALRAAMAKARTRAETLAEAAGVQLGPLQELVTGGAVGPAPVYERMAMTSAADTPIEPGEITVERTVTAAWRLEPPEEP